MKPLYQILEDINSHKKIEDRLTEIKKNLDNTKFFKTFVDYVYNPNIIWNLPDGDPYDHDEENLRKRFSTNPNYTDAELVNGIRQEFRMFKYFIKYRMPNGKTVTLDNQPEMKPQKIEMVFMEVVKAIHPKDAEILTYVKEHRDFPHRNINKALFEKAFPTMAEKWKV